MKLMCARGSRREQIPSPASLPASPFQKSGSLWGSFLITCLLNNTFQGMFSLKIFFSGLRSHSRILEVAFRELPASIGASRLDIVLIIY